MSIGFHGSYPSPRYLKKVNAQLVDALDLPCCHGPGDQRVVEWWLRVCSK